MRKVKVILEKINEYKKFAELLQKLQEAVSKDVSFQELLAKNCNITSADIRDMKIHFRSEASRIEDALMETEVDIE